VDAPPLAGSRPAGAPAQVEAAPYDVLIVGAGLSGIGAARHLQRRCPGKRFVLLEGRAAIGGTWDLFRYPGVRSDSDMYTLGYDFRPWGGAKLIADGPEILEYIRRAAQEGGIEAHIRFGHRVRSASWSSALACWRVEALRADGSCAVLHARFLQVCSGYFRYDRGHRPEFAGEADFRGTLVHAQFWPEGLDLAGRRVVVVGSGATAVTLVPALAQQAASVTMLQRSPTYVVTLPAHDPLARLFAALLLRRLLRCAGERDEVLRGVVVDAGAERLRDEAERHVGAVADDERRHVDGLRLAVDRGLRRADLQVHGVTVALRRDRAVLVDDRGAEALEDAA